MKPVVVRRKQFKSASAKLCEDTRISKLKQLAKEFKAQIVVLRSVERKES